MSFLPPLIDVERHFVVTLMASTEINVPDKVKALRHYREEVAKKRAAAQVKKKQVDGKLTEGASTVADQVLESSPERSPLKKRQKRTSAVDRQKKVATNLKDKSAEVAFEPDSSMKLLASGLSSF